MTLQTVEVSTEILVDITSKQFYPVANFVILGTQL